MNFFKPTFLVLMLLAAGNAVAQAVSAGEWISYRDAYKSMLWFEKYGKPKHFLQNHFQLVAKDGTASFEGLQLSLNGQTTHLNLPVDATGRSVLPLLKAAYDENAELVLNGKASQYRYQARVSIVLRADGVYEAADLRAACEQLLAYQNYLGVVAARGKKCTGVRLAYSKKSPEPLVEFRQTDRSIQPLAVGEGSAFSDESNKNFKTVNFVFSAWPEKGQLLTHSAPLAIAALLE